MENKRIIIKWFDLYSDDIYQFLIYRVGVKDAEDLVQEVFIRALKNIDSFQDEGKEKSWLYSIARNLAVDEIRKRSRNKWKTLLSSDIGQEGTNEVTPETILEKNEINIALYNGIHRLKPTYRDVIILKGLKELSVSETAAVLDWKESKVRLTYHRAKLALKRELGGVQDEK
ncbi:RNA polymerase sigma factor [Evansella sp. AB-P1]|uniref:RNA polymerase sigma factor n=1 Tax=Evansella sp. AB-P1 TaxID=3037653 RepID=UPI00241C5DFB|nr:RNA polymerase sigma factor [Evansella sp. AB-P1]MDG5786362.1 RNA polymerase sigma factor [Evansella sp. AB-P1]